MIQSQAFEDMKKVGEFSLETIKRLGSWNTRFWDRLTEQQLAGVALWMDAGLKQLRLLGQSENPYEIYAGQAQLAQEYAEHVSEYVRRCAADVAGAQNDFNAVFRPPAKETQALISSATAATETVLGADKPKTATGRVAM